LSGILGDAFVAGAMGCATAGAVVGLFSRGAAAADWVRRLTLGFLLFMFLAVAVMETALLGHDFSVKYVAKVGSLASPTHITFVSLWSSLEGSILFWGLVLGGYLGAFALRVPREHGDLVPRALGASLVTAAFFAFLMMGPANPFTPAPSPVPADGPGPNPLLQNHVLMIIHPPMLYLGYVGMALPFGVAVAALLRGELGAAWLRVLRVSLLLPWAFLTCGITLGGWWAYEVLGWGGYWAWDPVENASFMPWLTATAALHAAMLPNRRGSMKTWTLALTLATFLLTMLGTFMTRSGVFNSVHSFSQSDIGPVFLGFLAVALLACVVLVAVRAERLGDEGEPPALASREGAFLVNNLLFSALAFTVLIGTTFPLIVEAVQDRKISVGEPYFNRMAVPIGVAILFLMGIGPALPWGASAGAMRTLRVPAVLGAVAGGIGLALGMREAWPLLTLVGVGFSGTVTVQQALAPTLGRQAAHREAFRVAFVKAFSRGRRRFGGYVVHLGIVVMILAIAMSSAYREDQEVVLARGASVTWHGYVLSYVGAREVEEPHRTRQIADLTVEPGGLTLAPALNAYPGSMNAIGSPEVLSTPTHDLYVSLMSIDPDNAGLHLYHTPLVVWIWLGAGVVLLGAGIAAWPGPAPSSQRAA
jgi:cytochrome c-type biogenesis protein CcmF